MKKIVMIVACVIAGLGCSLTTQGVQAKDDDNEILIGLCKISKAAVNNLCSFAKQNPDIAITCGVVTTLAGVYFCLRGKLRDYVVGPLLMVLGAAVAKEGQEAKRDGLSKLVKGVGTFVKTNGDLAKTWYHTPLSSFSFQLDTTIKALKNEK